MGAQDFRASLAEQVKLVGQEIIDRAEDIVGSGDVLHSLRLTVDFPIPFDSLPTIRVSREYLSKRVFDHLLDLNDRKENFHD